MGNCLRRNRRNGLDRILMSDEGSHVAIGQNQPLSTAPEVWRADIEVTEGQLRGKRDTFWDTAPAYDGRREIWDALKAACEAAEEGDHGLAQAILDGASISLPRGRLVEAYDELGNRYVVPKYCISKPTNMAGSSRYLRPANPVTAGVEDVESQEPCSTTQLLQGHPPSSSPGSESRGGARKRRNSKEGRRMKVTKKTQQAVGVGLPRPALSASVPTGDPVAIRIRLSTLPKDIKLTLQAADTVKDLKRRLKVEHDLSSKHITLLYSGHVLRDDSYIKHLDIPKGFIIQAIVN